jgi:hypothetical protein
MPPLLEIQSAFRNAIIDGEAKPIAPLLSGGERPEKRLTVHQRNYHSSLVDALLVKFPATGWLIGTPLLTDAAQRFVREHPPHAPCIAEYGDGFSAFLSACAKARRIPYLRDFAELEWRVGRVAIAVDVPSPPGDVFGCLPADELPNLHLSLQPGLHYWHASWPVDDLMRLFLADTAPEHLEVEPADICLEIRGARGEFVLNRLVPAEFFFRESLAQGGSIGDAVESALNVDPGFDPGQAIAALIVNHLIAHEHI